MGKPPHSEPIGELRPMWVKSSLATTTVGTEEVPQVADEIAAARGTGDSCHELPQLARRLAETAVQINGLLAVLAGIPAPAGELPPPP